MIDASGKKILVVVADFNKEVTDLLVDGAKSKYIELKGKLSDIEIVSVPGAFELPGTISTLLKRKDNFYDAVIAFGVIIKGETAHFEFISNAVSNGIMDISIKSNIPILFGVLTCYDLQQAIDRSDKTKKDKGGEVLESAIKTISIYEKAIFD